MLFVMAMDVLNRLFSWVDSQGYLTSLGTLTPSFRASLYADDLVIFLAPSQHDMAVIKGCLDLFAASSGLVANLEKMCGYHDSLLRIGYGRCSADYVV